MRLLYPLVICIMAFGTNAWAQCKADVQYTIKEDGDKPTFGTVIVKISSNSHAGKLSLYSISGPITLVNSKDFSSSSSQRIVFTSLKEADYLIKVEWDNGCISTLGGFEGIQIREKAP